MSITEWAFINEDEVSILRVRPLKERLEYLSLHCKLFSEGSRWSYIRPPPSVTHLPHHHSNLVCTWMWCFKLIDDCHSYRLHTLELRLQSIEYCFQLSFPQCVLFKSLLLSLLSSFQSVLSITEVVVNELREFVCTHSESLLDFLWCSLLN